MRRLLCPLLCAAALGCQKSPPADGNPAPSSRATRRVSIEMLRRSFPVVFGSDLDGEPITWTVGDQVGFDAFSRALGEPDYFDVVEANLDPSPLYLKFLDDAARDGCGKALAADAARPDPRRRALLRHANLSDIAGAAIDRNLRYLRLRFHGIHVGSRDDGPIAGLRQLFANAVVANGGSTIEGWRAVCIALVTAPEFSLY
ncbi:MAG: hypothetical protein ACJ78X_11965 [Myxococcales bacterium]